MWLHSLKVAQLLRSVACLHTNQSRSYLNHPVYSSCWSSFTITVDSISNYLCGNKITLRRQQNILRNDFNVGQTLEVRHVSVRDCTPSRSPTLVTSLTLEFSQRMARLFVTTLRSEGSSYARINPSTPASISLVVLKPAASCRIQL